MTLGEMLLDEFEDAVQLLIRESTGSFAPPESAPPRETGSLIAIGRAFTVAVLIQPRSTVRWSAPLFRSAVGHGGDHQQHGQNEFHNAIQST